MRKTAMGALITMAAVAPAEASTFPDCVAGLRRSAIVAGVDKALAARALDLTKPDEKVLRLSQVQPEFSLAIWDYIAFLVDDRRIQDGRVAMQRHDRVLRAAERRYGVPRHILVAVWGAETDYGREMGEHYLPNAFATLACAGEGRTEFWRGELIAALSLVGNGDLDLKRLHGSWAGAFGHTQFMPSSYRRHAVDFDGDGRRDLVGSVADALASTGNYLRRAGWRPGEPAMVEVRVPPGYAGPMGRTAKAPLALWAQRGLVRVDGGPLAGTARAGLLMPAGPQGPGLLMFRNFDAIYAYNHADSYAIAVAHLADRLAGLPGFRTPWPTDDPGLSRAEFLALQKLLVARGYDIGDADGKMGSRTRAGIMAAEQRLGLPVTGRAGRKIYRALGGK